MAIAEVRTQIYLPRAVHGELRKEARAQKKSMAQIVREAVETHLAERSATKLDWERDPLARILGKGKGPPDLSIRHDDYLYGKKR